MFLDHGKPVIAPEGLWKGRPEFATRLTYPERSTTKVHSLPVRDGAQTLKFISFPGHQGPTVTAPRPGAAWSP